MTLPEDHTANKLAHALRAVGLNDMAARAAEGYYHDFLSPLDFPELELMRDLEKARMAGNIGAAQLIARHIEGDFDASFEESEAWAASAEGRETLASVLGRPVSLGGRA
ncbi:hypothetical protein [Rhodovulum visakhapatnamense]|uniref:Uncharacterized protein n=1 Tax=Rhodovulum visakhapatnamense TaxID=364297 RepID=A0A4R8F977_9RHOB|nr:hypothetical protein [Rhodovulum visakhapatnamense]TDX22180.1 hypothetical protein EV657_13215 [Rhodovulum visakhapatnamense]